MKGFPIQTALSIAMLALLLAIAQHFAPAIHAVEASQLSALLEFTPATTPASPLTRAVETVPESPVVFRPQSTLPAVLPAVLPGAFPAALLDDSNHSLDHFLEALCRTENRTLSANQGAVTRIVHYGDSPTTADLITGDVRSLLQKRFGDAGHGFILIAKPWAWYQHNGVALTGSGWQSSPASHFEAHDGMFGLGGVSFTGAGKARSRIVLETGPHSHFEVWFLRQPDGGTLGFSADGKPLGNIDTAADTKSPGFASFDVPGGASDLELHVEQGRVRVFGVSAEKSGTNGTGGVVYDSLGLNGASITVLSRMFNAAHWAAELQHRNPQLVIVNYGTNEADFAAFVDKGYEKELREAIRRLRAALPEASILVMGPMDRGHRTGPGEIETMPTIPRIVALQKRVAQETGCGFFDTFAAMGGAGTMARWYAAQPRLVSADFIHPYPAGGKMIAVVFTKEIGLALNRYKRRHNVKPTTAIP
ncbi:MAG TPA: GDSL-type esterase/lipase family protein [Candidatus Acidoferrales bacterium]|jgi:lysophospholipase L1-like esterase|nr:GDSL-type esterase/lipase family protein [Candidatus Acidoferrales bacterium]